MLLPRVGPDGRTRDLRIEALSPAQPALGRCIIAAVRDIRFPLDSVGADVAYPVRYRAEYGAVPTGHAPAPAYRLLRRARLVGSTWPVVDEHGRGVSDIDLALAAGAQQAHAELAATETAYGIAALIEGALAAGGIAVGLVASAADGRLTAATLDRLALPGAHQIDLGDEGSWQ